MASTRPRRPRSFRSACAPWPPASPARIREAYLAPWRAHGPLRDWPARRLDRALALAERVAALFYAVQFRRFALPVIETSWEVREFCPSFLRALLREAPGGGQALPSG
jgi:hypothetical protein